MSSEIAHIDVKQIISVLAGWEQLACLGGESYIHCGNPSLIDHGNCRPTGSFIGKATAIRDRDACYFTGHEVLDEYIFDAIGIGLAVYKSRCRRRERCISPIR